MPVATDSRWGRRCPGERSSSHPRWTRRCCRSAGPPGPGPGVPTSLTDVARLQLIDDLRTVLVHRDFRKLFTVRLVSQCGDGLFQAGLATLFFLNPENLATAGAVAADRKSTRLNSSHVAISYAVFCLEKRMQA